MMLFGYALAIALGYLLIRCVRPAALSVPESLFLSPGLGLGAAGLIPFISVQVFGRVHAAFVWVAFLTLFVSAAVFATLSRKNTPQPDASSGQNRFYLALMGVLLLGGALFLLRAGAAPFGTGLDAWSIWRLKARVLFLDDHALTHFFAPSYGFAPRDYPLYYPLAIVWGWICARDVTPLAPAVLMALFSFSTCGLLFCALRRVERLAAWAGAALLFSTPHFFGMAASQYADTVLMYFNLASLLLVHRALTSRDGRTALLAGLFLSAGAWVKNEGLLFLLAVTIGVVLARPQKRWWLHAVAGAAPFLAVIVYFKAWVPTPNDVVSAANLRATLGSVPDLWQRFLFVGDYLLKETFSENLWVYAWVFLLLAPVLYPRRALTQGQAWVWVVFGVWFAGILGVYLIAWKDPTWKSWDRMLLHVFPAFTYAVLAFIVFPAKLGAIRTSK